MAAHPAPSGRATRRRRTPSQPRRLAGLGLTVLVLGHLVTGPFPRVDPPRCPHPQGPPSSPTPVPEAATPDSRKGPVGWSTFRSLDRLPMLPVGTQPRMFSSADPRGGNADGFRGTYLCRAPDGYVLGEHAGPGELTSLWFTRGDGDVRANGNLRIQLDGETVLDAPLQDVVDGRLGPPFVHPLVANAEQSSGGVHIQVPMPFQRSMRVLTTAVPRFHRVQYRVFADAVGVPRFDPTDGATDVVAALRQAGERDPKPPADAERVVRRQVRLAPGEALPPVRLRGPAMISELRLRLPQVAALGQRTRGDGRVGSVETVVDVAPDNDGVRLVRRSADRAAVQVAPVLVDGDPTPRSFGPPRRRPSGELVQTLEVPAPVTMERVRLPLADVHAGPASLEVQSRVDGAWVTTDRVELPRPDPGLPVEAAPDPLLQGLRVRMTFDGRRTVDAPVGEFFGVGLGERPVGALLFGVDPLDGYRSWWPMPLADTATVTLYNGSEQPVTDGDLHVTWHPDARWARELGPGGRAGHFHATSRAGRAIPGQDWELATLEGHGRVVGVSQTVLGSQPGRTYLEGDERVRVDGTRSTQLHGTGTEDLYLAGWYYNRGPFTTPFVGHSAHLEGTPGCPYECDAMYRVLVADAWDFHRGLRAGIEHGPDNRFEAEYRTTTWWYGRDEPALRPTDRVDVGSPRSERAAGMVGGGELRRLTAHYAGPAGDVAITDLLRVGHDEVRFRVALDPDNVGAVLRRRADQARRGQAAQVLVDGVPAGVWLQPDGNSARRWLDDQVFLPAALTQGRGSVEVTLRPLPDAPAWTAARYEVFSLHDPGGPTSPAPVTSPGGARPHVSGVAVVQ